MKDLLKQVQEIYPKAKLYADFIVINLDHFYKVGNRLRISSYAEHCGYQLHIFNERDQDIILLTQSKDINKLLEVIKALKKCEE